MDKRDLARLFSKEQNVETQVLLTCKPLSKLEYQAKSHIILHCQTCGQHQHFKKLDVKGRWNRKQKFIPKASQHKYQCTVCGEKVWF